MRYPALFDPDRKAGGCVITFPDFTWGVTQGETEAEAMEMASDLLSLLIQECINRGQPLPKPSRSRGRNFRLVRLPALQAAKTLLYKEWMDSGIRKAEFARRLGIPKSNLDRLFDMRHHSRLDQIEAAFEALGKRLMIDVADAA